MTTRRPIARSSFACLLSLSVGLSGVFPQALAESCRKAPGDASAAVSGAAPRSAIASRAAAKPCCCCLAAGIAPGLGRCCGAPCCVKPFSKSAPLSAPSRGSSQKVDRLGGSGCSVALVVGSRVPVGGARPGDVLAAPLDTATLQSRRVRIQT